MEKYDTIIVGATAAYELSKKGFNVLALDKQKHPGYKPCGGGMFFAQWWVRKRLVYQ